MKDDKIRIAYGMAATAFILSVFISVLFALHCLRHQTKEVSGRMCGKYVRVGDDTLFVNQPTKDRMYYILENGLLIDEAYAAYNQIYE